MTGGAGRLRRSSVGFAEEAIESPGAAADTEAMDSVSAPTASSPSSLRSAPPEAEPISVRVREACRISGIGRSKLYELIGAGEIAVIKVGSITLIPLQSLRSFLESRQRSAG